LNTDLDIFNDIKYLDILKLNKKISFPPEIDKININILSNITMFQIKEILEYSLKIEELNVEVSLGNYDNIIQDSKNYNNDITIIFWELANIVPCCYSKLEIDRNNDELEIYTNLVSEIELVFTNLSKNSLVLMNKFSSLNCSYSIVRTTKIDNLSDKLNTYLQDNLPDNFKLIDINKVISTIGVAKAFDFKNYFLSESLYTVDFFQNYSLFVKPYIMALTGKIKKALILDCDNTLWKGIVGEDGLDKIEMSDETKEGKIFSEIQSLALSLTKKGVLLGLCSKNNPNDIEDVLETHPNMQLKSHFITIKKINWKDKATNIREIASELNIGLDSLVFIDDASFEINLIREQLPEVSAFQVPKKLYEYPDYFRRISNLFCNLYSTEEDENKVEIYKDQKLRDENKRKYSNVEDYLASLELKMSIYDNDKSIIPRLSQLSQKTNQFNLTTKRYSKTEIENMINSNDFGVYAFSVSDKFGDNGITGMCILHYFNNEKRADIDIFLMSCRIIGRNIEYAFMDFIIGKLIELNISSLKATYISTKKNEQVSMFYNQHSFRLIKESGLKKYYEIEIDDYTFNNIPYIQIIN